MSGNPNALSHLWQELKLRKVVRVIHIYAVLTFVELELMDILVPSLGLQNRTIYLVLMIFIVGSIIAVFPFKDDSPEKGNEHIMKENNVYIYQPQQIVL